MWALHQLRCPGLLDFYRAPAFHWVGGQLVHHASITQLWPRLGATPKNVVISQPHSAMGPGGTGGSSGLSPPLALSPVTLSPALSWHPGPLRSTSEPPCGPPKGRCDWEVGVLLHRSPYCRTSAMQTFAKYLPLQDTCLWKCRRQSPVALHDRLLQSPAEFSQNLPVHQPHLHYVSWPSQRPRGKPGGSHRKTYRKDRVTALAAGDLTVH